MRNLIRWWQNRRQQIRWDEEERKLREFKLQAYEEMMAYVREGIAEQLVYPDEVSRELGFVPRWMFELYGIGLPPAARYTDVKWADLGFNNLLWKGRAITWDYQPPPT